MKRYSLASSLALAPVVMIGFALIVFQTPSDDFGGGAGRVPKYSWSEMISIFQEERRLDEAAERLQHFRETLRQIKQDMLAGSLHLDEAALRLEEAAHADNALFFQAIGHSFPGRPVREQLNLVLLAHLEVDAELDRLTPEERDRVVQLRQEVERSNRGGEGVRQESH